MAGCHLFQRYASSTLLNATFNMLAMGNPRFECDFCTGASFQILSVIVVIGLLDVSNLYGVGFADRAELGTLQDSFDARFPKLNKYRHSSQPLKPRSTDHYCFL